MTKCADYNGFELGPIRPPSEAGSLMLRITRNCPWNSCTFCGLYKGEKFSVRPVSHIISDIDLVRYFVDEVEKLKAQPGGATHRQYMDLLQGRRASDQMALHTSLLWVQSGKKSVFLQDANTLVIKPDDLVAILGHIKKVFPQVERITSYARSHTIARISDEDLARIAAAGLNRIHIGMESASEKVLEFVKKGADKKTHILAGQKVKRAGIELSEYFMPGLGGEQFSRENALESADALNQINPDFIRIRSLGLPESIELYQEYLSGTFVKLGDVQMAEELLLMLDHLEGVTSRVKSDHILNLFQEVEGRLPEDAEKMKAPIRKFLGLQPEEQLLYMVGRRAGIFHSLGALQDPQLRQQAGAAKDAHRVTLDNVDEFTAEMMKQFI